MRYVILKHFSPLKMFLCGPLELIIDMLFPRFFLCIFLFLKINKRFLHVSLFLPWETPRNFNFQQRFDEILSTESCDDAIHGIDQKNHNQRVFNQMETEKEKFPISSFVHIEKRRKISSCLLSSKHFLTEYYDIVGK